MADLPKIYIDSCCFISLARHKINGSFVEVGHEQDIYFLAQILQAAKDSNLQLFCSALTIAECLGIRDNEGNICYGEDIQRLFKSILLSGLICHVAPDPFVSFLARDLLWKHDIKGLKSMEAVHIASALHVGCKEFLTQDGANKKSGLLARALDFKSIGLDVLLPSDTKYLPNEYLQEKLTYGTQEGA